MEKYPDFMTIKEFAFLMRVHSNTIRRWIKGGHLNAFRGGSGVKSGYRIPIAEINRLSLVHLEIVINRLIDERENKKMIQSGHKDG